VTIAQRRGVGRTALRVLLWTVFYLSDDVLPG